MQTCKLKTKIEHIHLNLKTCQDIYVFLELNTYLVVKEIEVKRIPIY